MKRLFDPEAVKAQIANLLADRERIDQAVNALQMALRSVESAEFTQPQLLTSLNTSGVTLNDAVRAVCTKMVDGITRQRVLSAIEREYPMFRPKSSSVAASLIKLTRGDTPMLKLAIPGIGATPAYYSTEGDIDLQLSADEISVLMGETATKGTGGWQSLWAALQKRFDKATGKISLTPALRAKIYLYRKYGEGGWQSKSVRVFRRHLPHLFA
jgi:hypothetical protein